MRRRRRRGWDLGVQVDEEEEEDEELHPRLAYVSRTCARHLLGKARKVSRLHEVVRKANSGQGTACDCDSACAAWPDAYAGEQGLLVPLA